MVSRQANDSNACNGESLCCLLLMPSHCLDGIF